VGTLPDGPQTVSVHLYGAGFDLDEGVALDDEGRIFRYRRGAFGELERVMPALRGRGGPDGGGGA
jgi:hypothetical protein